jgi:hypothetical protein
MISKIQNVINSQSIYLQIQTILLGKSLLRNNNKVDSLWECAIKQTVMTVAQWRRNQIIRGPLVIGKAKMFKMDSCLRGAILNLTAFCSIWAFIEECSSIDT